MRGGGIPPGARGAPRAGIWGAGRPGGGPGGPPRAGGPLGMGRWTPGDGGVGDGAPVRRELPVDDGCQSFLIGGGADVYEVAIETSPMIRSA